MIALYWVGNVVLNCFGNYDRVDCVRIVDDIWENFPYKAVMAFSRYVLTYLLNA